MNLVFLGPPGAGKGTQAIRIAEKFKLVHLSTGNLLRNAVENQTELGQKAKAYMSQGGLVPDDIVISLIREKLPSKGGFVLDGFPRTLEQAKALDSMLEEAKQSIDRVINLNVGDEEVVRRLSGRRQCAKGCIYNIYYRPPKREGICDNCNGVLTQRADDQADTVQKRLQVYHEQTKPLIHHYKNQDKLQIVEGSARPEDITACIYGIISG